MRTHTVGLISPERHVLHLARCTCGWAVGYDTTSYAAALDASHAHVQDAYLEELERRTGTAETIGE